jgi:N-acetylmuramic acid 6-phosphate etherase
MSSEVHDELNELSTERANPASANIDCLSPLDIVRIMNDEDAQVATAVRAELPQIGAAIEQIAERMSSQEGRLIYIGAGTSGRLGVLDASECPPTFSTPPELVIGRIAGGPDALTSAVEELEDSAEAGRVDVERLGVTAADTVVGITASGRTPYVLGAIADAHERGALTIGLACNPQSQLETLVQIMIAPEVGPEVLSGSTRLKAGTAQKMVLNMISTGTMILLGKTFGNLMVDLRATNSKLRQRAVRIVREATGLPESAAAAALRDADGEAKTAIVAARAGITPAEARIRLARARGSVRAALGERAPCPE